MSCCMILLDAESAAQLQVKIQQRRSSNSAAQYSEAGKLRGNRILARKVYAYLLRVLGGLVDCLYSRSNLFLSPVASTDAGPYDTFSTTPRMLKSAFQLPSRANLASSVSFFGEIMKLPVELPSRSYTHYCKPERKALSTGFPGQRVNAELPRGDMSAEDNSPSNVTGLTQGSVHECLCERRHPLSESFAPVAHLFAVWENEEVKLSIIRRCLPCECSSARTFSSFKSETPCPLPPCRTRRDLCGSLL